MEIVVRIELTLTGLQPAAFPLGYTIIKQQMAPHFHNKAVRVYTPHYSYCTLSPFTFVGSYRCWTGMMAN